MQPNQDVKEDEVWKKKQCPQLELLLTPPPMRRKGKLCFHKLITQDAKTKIQANHLFFFFDFNVAQLTCYVVLVPGVQQSESVICIHIATLFPYRLLQNIGQSTLCCTVGPCYYLFSTQQCVHMTPNLLTYPSTPHFPFGNHEFAQPSFLALCRREK